jgi:PAS domain S-box-containing protein
MKPLPQPCEPIGGTKSPAPVEEWLLESVSDGLLRVDGEWRVRWVNAAGERLLGRGREQLLGEELWAVLPGVDESALGAAWRRAMAERMVQRLEAWCTPLSAWLEVQALPDAAGLVLVVRDKTEQRLAEEESQRLHRLLLESSALVAFTRGAEHRVSFCNPALGTLLGVAAPEGMPLRQVLPEPRGQAVLELVEQVHARGEGAQGRELRVVLQRHGRAEESYLDVDCQPLRGRAGGVEGVLLVAFDVTERVTGRRAMEEVTRDLAYSQERYRALLAAVAEVLWETPPSGEFATDQPGWRSFTGQSSEELAGWGWLEVVHPEDREGTVRAWETALKSGSPFQVEYRLRRQDGVYRHMLAHAVPIRDSQGRVLEWQGALRDITRQRQDQAELARLLLREQRHSAQLQGLAGAALAVSEADSVEQVLRVVTEQAREVIGAHQAVTTVASPEGWSQALHLVSLSDKYAAWRSYEERPDGSGIYSWVCRLNLPMRLTQQELETHPAWRGFGQHASRHPPLRGWLAAPLVARDGRNLGLVQLSDRCEGDFTAEDEAVLVQLARMASVAIENTRLMAETQAANRAKDEFLAVMSHELRTPLTAVLGWTQMLRGARKGDPKALDKGLAVIERNARTLAQLIEDVLDVSRVITGKLTLHRRSVDLVGVVQAAVEVVRTHADQKGVVLGVDVEVAGGPALLAGDPARLQQVLWNLLVNAVKFTPAGGRVQVRVQRADRELRVGVKDTGCGIRSEALPHLFERFWQADGSATREHGGLGLGLAIVRHLVELHGGSVRAESAGEGQGSTFTVVLPVPAVLPEPEPTEEPAGSEAPAAVRLDGIGVLLVEDAADARELMSMLLRERGAQVRTAASAAEALEAVRVAVPDVLVSDIALPQEDGHSLLRRLRAWVEARDIWVPAIALTAYAGAEDARRAYRAGFQVHLAKPVEPSALVEAVARLAAKGRPEGT